MRPRRDLTSLALAASLLLLAAGCGGGEEDGPPPAEEASSDPPAATDTARAVLRTPAPNELPEEARSDLLEAPGTVLLYFHAPWHGRSQNLLPVVEDLGASEEGLTTRAINVDEHQAVVQAFRVPSVPTAALLRDGTILHALVGEQVTEAGLRSFADRPR